MTPNTQSVCKHCQRPESEHDLRGLFCRTKTVYQFEPVAEPASTGEPQLWDCYSRESGNLLVGRIKASSADEAEGIGAREIYADKKDLAVRPSEPSAPQTSTEPKNKCDFCRDGGRPTEDGFHTGIVNDYKCRNAAPQPVSGDALKVEEIRPRCPNCGRWNVCLRRDFDDRLYVTCGACNFEVPLNMGTIKCLSPFFPLTSTAQTTPAHFSDCDYDCSCGWKKDPDSHLGAVRD